RLIIYPNGISNKGRGGYVSLYLAMASTSSLPADWELNVVFNILLFDQIHDNYVSVRGSQRRFTALKHEWGFPKFITKASLKEPSNGYVMNDICVVGAEVFVTKSERTIECLSLLSGGSPYVQKWEIPEFSKLGLVWTSEEFIAGNHKWTINLYPKGNGGGKGKNVSVYLSCIDAKASAPSAHDKKVKVNFSLSIKNQFNSKRSKCHASDHWFSSSASAWGWSHFISLDDFNDPNTGFLVKDRCTVQVEISVKVSLNSNASSPSFESLHNMDSNFGGFMSVPIALMIGTREHRGNWIGGEVEVYRFTWCNRWRYGETVRARLDRACANLSWLGKFPKDMVSHRAVWNSNHKIMIVDVETKGSQQIQRKAQFRFKAKWLQYDIGPVFWRVMLILDYGKKSRLAE
ncbi:UNVERIFIED_CONTAM: hypothetical protein Sindi_1628800, partial [Sesamum indicum]